MSDTFEQGWAARPFKQQFPELEKRTAEHLDVLNMAITRLSVNGLLTDSQTRDIRHKKFPKIVTKEVMGAREKVAKQQAEVKV